MKRSFKRSLLGLAAEIPAVMLCALGTTHLGLSLYTGLPLVAIALFINNLEMSSRGQ